MKKIILLSIASISFLTSSATTPDWTNNISCILYSHCTSCHNPAGIAPSSLLSYSDAAYRATQIRNYVQDKIMPPFLADVNYQQYAHQKTLTQSEIDQITDWVNNGAPSGDTTLAPAQPTYTSGPVISNPGFSSIMPTYTIPALSNDMYRCFIISNPFPADKYITAFEVIPGNRAAVHHVLIYSDNSSIPVNLDNADPDPGYVNFGGTGSSSSSLIGGYVPGSDPYFLPNGMGMKVAAGSRIIIQVHYPISASGMIDSTRINFRYSTGTVRQAYDAPILYHYSPSLIDGPLTIPAGEIKTFHEQYQIPVAASILSIAPHAHLICTGMTSYAVTPAHDTIHLVTIPHWDFHWQSAYYFQKPVYLPAGTTLYGEGTYDNTDNNPENPNNPPQDVSLGESTTDEMLLFYFVYVAHQAGDENIVVDTSGHMDHYLNCSSLVAGISENHSLNGDFLVYPNPSAQEFNIEFPPRENFNITVRDMHGRTVCERKNLFGKTKINSGSFSEGVYLVHAVGSTGNEYYKKLLVIK